MFSSRQRCLVPASGGQLVTGMYLQAARAEAVRELSRLKMAQQTSDALQRNMHVKYNTLAETNAVLESELQSRDSRDEGVTFDTECELSRLKMAQQTSDALQRNMHVKYNTLAETNAVLESELQSRDSRDEGVSVDTEARIRGINEHLHVICPQPLVMPWNTECCLGLAHTKDLYCLTQCSVWSLSVFTRHFAWSRDGT